MPRTKLARFPGIALGLLLLLTPGTIASDVEEPDSAPTLLDRMEKELQRARGQISNTSSRVRNGIIGVGGDARDGTGSPSPAMQCCGKNIEKLRLITDELARVHRDLELCYRSAGETDCGTALELAQEDLLSLRRTVEAFARTTTRPQTQAGVMGLTRAFLRLRESSDELTPCPPEGEAGVDSSEAERAPGGGAGGE